MFCHNNLLNRKFSFHKIKNVHFTFVPFLTRKKKLKNHGFIQNSEDLQKGNSRYLSSVQSHSLWSVITSLYSGKESIYQSMASSPSRYISDDH